MKGVWKQHEKEKILIVLGFLIFSSFCYLQYQLIVRKIAELDYPYCEICDILIIISDKWCEGITTSMSVNSIFPVPSPLSLIASNDLMSGYDSSRWEIGLYRAL
jgi:hypothetical protein